MQIHGTREEFINDVANRLLERVNAEAGDLEQAKLLCRGYLSEFCDEYDRCAYGRRLELTKSGNNQKSSPSSNLQRITPQSNQNEVKKLSFDNQILKKGVRALSKKLRENQEAFKKTSEILK